MEINVGLLAKEDLSPDEYCFLYCRYNKITILFRHNVDFSSLERKGWIKNTNEGMVLRGKSNDLFKSEEWDYEKHNQQITKRVKGGKTLEEEVKEYRALFPSGTKEAGRAIIGSKAGCLKNMRLFKKKNPEYTFDVIINATKIYLNQFKSRKKEWRFVRNADYFISKDGLSELETWCEMLTNGSVKPVDEQKSEGYVRDL